MSKEKNSWDKKRLAIESFVAILCAVLGIIFGKVTSTYYYNGQKISESELNDIMSENSDFKAQNESLKTDKAELSSQISQLTADIQKCEKDNEELTKVNESLNEQIIGNPVIENRSLGLSIDGEERLINKDEASLLVNGRQYYSKEIVDNLLPDNKNAVEKNDMLYVGKIIKEKVNLLDQQIIDISQHASIQENIKDTYGNIHTKAVVFALGDDNISINANREYSNLKFKMAVVDSKKGGGIIQIESEQGVLFISDNITSTVEPIEFDIPINQASKISIQILDSDKYKSPYLMITDAILYNAE